MTRDHDEAVRSALRELRGSVEREAPAFAIVIDRPQRSFAIDGWRAVRVAVAACLLVAAGVDGARRIEAWRTRLVVPTAVRELSAWRPMTDVLLQTPNAGILIQPRGMDQSLLPINPILEDDQ